MGDSIYILGDAACLMLSGFFAGLTLAVMGLDCLELEVLADAGFEPDRSRAAKILPLRRTGHQLLLTLVCGNVMSNALVALLTKRFAVGFYSVALSTALIALFGDLLPQAAMSAWALEVGARSTWLVRILMTLFYPICKPVAMLLNITIGSDADGQIYSRRELRRLIEIYANRIEVYDAKLELDRVREALCTTPSVEYSPTPGYWQRLLEKFVQFDDEVLLPEQNPLQLAELDTRLMLGVMDLHDMTARDVITPIESVFMLEISDILTTELIAAVQDAGFSRIPVYEVTRNCVIGIIRLNDLLVTDTADELEVWHLLAFQPGHQIIHVDADVKLIHLLEHFRSGVSHLAIVHDSYVSGSSDPHYRTIGVVTLEDIIIRLYGPKNPSPQSTKRGSFMDVLPYSDSGIEFVEPSDTNPWGSGSPALVGVKGSGPVPRNALRLRAGGLYVTPYIMRLLFKNYLPRTFMKIAAEMFRKHLRVIDMPLYQQAAIAVQLADLSAPGMNLSKQQWLDIWTKLLTENPHAIHLRRIRRAARTLPLTSMYNLWIYLSGTASDVITLILDGDVQMLSFPINPHLQNGGTNQDETTPLLTLRDEVPEDTIVTTYREWSLFGTHALQESLGKRPIEYSLRVVSDTAMLFQIPAELVRRHFP